MQYTVHNAMVVKQLLILRYSKMKMLVFSTSVLVSCEPKIGKLPVSVESHGSRLCLKQHIVFNVFFSADIQHFGIPAMQLLVLPILRECLTILKGI